MVSQLPSRRASSNGDEDEDEDDWPDMGPPATVCPSVLTRRVLVASEAPVSDSQQRIVGTFKGSHHESSALLR